MAKGYILRPGMLIKTFLIPHRAWRLPIRTPAVEPRHDIFIGDMFTSSLIALPSLQGLALEFFSGFFLSHVKSDCLFHEPMRRKVFDLSQSQGFQPGFQILIELLTW